MIAGLLTLWLAWAPGEDSSPSDPSSERDDAAPSLADASSEDLEAARAEREAQAAAQAADAAAEGPPYYSTEDMDRLRERYQLEPQPKLDPPRPRWRCLIPDPRCGFGVELLATSAYAYRVRQGNIAVEGAFYEWNSARVSYELWIDFPAHVETIGKYKFTRLTLGPKVAVVGSDNQDLWGNVGIAGRYWFGRGPWAPALEFSSALSFKLTGEEDRSPGFVQQQRSPVGITADFGISIGGWGAIILGGQYDTPLAREDLPEKFRISSAGQVFVGFRGNVLWGAPAVAAFGTHAAVQRAIPQQP
ncbi:MAG: hypothetical protein KC431_06540 [Myxococcales bacterium]|nr:hypothetical protein [Myxococcales bacterium]